MCGEECRGQYSDAVLSELESQNDQQVEGMSAKVRMLKDVSFSFDFDECPLLYTESRVTAQMLSTKLEKLSC